MYFIPHLQCDAFCFSAYWPESEQSWGNSSPPFFCDITRQVCWFIWHFRLILNISAHKAIGQTQLVYIYFTHVNCRQKLLHLLAWQWVISEVLYLIKWMRCLFLPVSLWFPLIQVEECHDVLTDLDLLGWMSSCICWLASLHFRHKAFLYTSSAQLLCALCHSMS